MSQPTRQPPSAGRPGLLRRLLGALADMLPSGPPPPDPLITDMENLTPAEIEARYELVAKQERRGRGDGSIG